MRPTLMRALILTLLLVWPAAASSGEAVFDGVERVVVVGDVHGHLAPARSILIKAGLIDDEGDWSGGETHLVFIGDLLDRGDDGFEAMELVRRLERQSLEAGGRVHVVMGNHEAMNLTRDLRYVTEGAYADFADQINEKERKKQLKRYQQLRRSEGTRKELEATFAESFPPGFFARNRAMSADGAFGEWLLGLPLAVKINGILFCHGGIAPSLAVSGLEELNRRNREELGRWLDALAVLEEAGVINRLMQLPDILGLAKRINEDPGVRVSDEVKQAAEVIYAGKQYLALRSDGPLWHRDYAVKDAAEVEPTLRAVLETLGAHTMVIGHTPVESGRVLSRFGGALLRVDVAMWKDGGARAVEWVQGQLRVIDAEDGSQQQPDPVE